MVTQSVVKEIGILVPQFKEDKLIVLFGPAAPQELRDMSVIHEFEHLEEEPLKLGERFKWATKLIPLLL